MSQQHPGHLDKVRKTILRKCVKKLGLSLTRGAKPPGGPESFFRKILGDSFDTTAGAKRTLGKSENIVQKRNIDGGARSNVIAFTIHFQAWTSTESGKRFYERGFNDFPGLCHLPNATFVERGWLGVEFIPAPQQFRP